MTSALHRLTARELVRRLRSGELTGPEVARHFLDRCRRHDRSLAAFFAVAAEGCPAGPAENAPLAGLPFALKDTAPTAGLPTTYGSPAYSGHRATRDGTAALTWQRAGARCLGKTATSEFGCLCYVEPPASFASRPRNPYRPDWSAGGSSAGAAVAVAAQLLPIAHGSDSGGSIRIPAALTGIVGYKPSSCPAPGQPAWAAITTDGILARTVDDVRLTAPALGYMRPADPGLRPASHYRIGVLGGDDRDLHPAVAAAVTLVAAGLEGCGHRLVDRPAQLPAEHQLAYTTVWSARLAALPLTPEQADRIGEVPRLLRALGQAVTPAELATAASLLAAARESGAIGGWAGIDFQLGPVVRLPHLGHGELRRDGDPAAALAAQAEFAPYTVAGNVLGQPSVTVPVWLSADTLSAVLLTGRRGADSALLRLAADVERMSGGYREPPGTAAPVRPRPSR